MQCIKKWSVSSMPPQWGHSGSAPLYLKLLSFRPFTLNLSLVNVRSRSLFFRCIACELWGVPDLSRAGIPVLSPVICPFCFDFSLNDWVDFLWCREVIKGRPVC